MHYLKNYSCPWLAGGRAGYFSEKYLSKKVLTTERTIGPTMKASNPLTTKPGTRIEANQKQRPLITSAKAPKVMIVRGRERREMRGLIKALIAPIAAAAMRAIGKLAITTPLNRISTTNKPRAVANIDSNNPIIYTSQN
jgi:hypothetical protein